MEKKRCAGGMAALISSTKHVVKNRAFGLNAFLKLNQQDGFDCPGCAWPDPHKPAAFEFCENGIKAVAHETTSKKVGRDFFARHSVSELRRWDHYNLEQEGRLVEPMRYNAARDHYEPVSWEEAFEQIAAAMNDLDDPDQAVFYTSGRTSNEAAFLYQLMGRVFGTNNFPDCSNMCHESSGVALGETIGVGKGTVLLDDFHKADAIFIFGQNPGTNHPRMLTELQTAARRGAQIVSFNPLKEPGLMNFIHPKEPLPVLTNKATPLSTLYLQPRVGGDLAAIKGMIKHILESEAAAPGQVLDQDFIAEHTTGFAALKEDIEAADWEAIEAGCGLSREDLKKAADVYMQSDRVIACWAMGLTQQKHAVGSIQMVVNLLLLRGNIGKEGAGACPVRGHSNVQGDRTMGIHEKPPAAFLDALGRVFGFEPPRKEGYNTVEAIKAMAEGEAKVLFCMGGNFAAATPDTEFTEAAMQKLELNVQVSTKLNRSHLVMGKQALILPCLGRTEEDIQEQGEQFVTVEDSMSMVHASRGMRKPASDLLRSEPAIVAGLAEKLLGTDLVPWPFLCANYDRIRNKIEEVIPAFRKFNQRVRNPGGFYLGNSARDRDWQTEPGKAVFTIHPIPDTSVDQNALRLMTLRSHDQYNTTIYGLDDRYRGVKGKRKIVFLNHQDLKVRHLKGGDHVDLVSKGEDGILRRAEDFEIVPYDLPAGCAAAYFPETNVLVPIDSFADRSFTPTSKFIPITLEPRA